MNSLKRDNVEKTIAFLNAAGLANASEVMRQLLTDYDVLQSRIEALEKTKESLCKALDDAGDSLIEVADKIESLEKDAVRYQWLKTRHLRIWRSNLVRNLGAESMDLDFEAEGCDLDKAIDTAMQSEKGGV